MTRYRMLLGATWTVVTVSAVLIAWLAVSSAVANVADPAPAVIGGQRNGLPQSTTSTVLADQGAAPAADGVPAVVDAANGQSSPGSAESTTEKAGSGDGDSSAGRTDDPTASATPATNTQSFANEGGVVTLSCTGDAISLVSATPRQGYSVQVGNAGPSEVEVTFTSSSHNAEIHGRCDGGQPVATVSDD